MAVYEKAMKLCPAIPESIFWRRYILLKSEVLQTRRYDILKVKFDLIAYNVVMETIERWRWKL